MTTKRQFSIPEPFSVKINSVNPRAELHGSDHVAAVDVGITLRTGNTTLNDFDPSLLAMIYRKRGKADEAEGGTQGTIDGVEPVSDMPMLRSTVIVQPLRLSTELAGYTLAIEYGVKSIIRVEQCAVNKFRADCQAGGTVELSFRVQSANVDAPVLGRLAMLIDQEVKVTLTPPAAAQADIGEAGKP